MPRPRLPRVLAASFVVTVASAPATSGCKKQKVTEPEEGRSASVFPNGQGTCGMLAPQSCPEGASCNPPPPMDVDCPPNLRDGGEPAVARRPPGKEDWIRVRPTLWPTSSTACSFTPERFCAPPGKPFECTSREGAMTVPCAKVDVDAGADAGAGKSGYRVASFVFRDGVGGCHRTRETDCPSVGRCEIADGEVVPCP